MKRIPTPYSLLFILFIDSIAFSDIIPKDRRINWTPGIPESIERSETVDVMSFGAIGDGVTDDSDAFIKAVGSLPDHGVLYIPAGTYLIKKSLSISKGILLQGEGSENTRLLFDLGCRGDNCIDFVKYDRGNWINVLEESQKGSRIITVEKSGCFSSGDFVQIQQDNDPELMYTRDDWRESWAENAVGQILIVEEVKGDTLVLQRPLNITYRLELNPQVRTLGLITYPGVEDLYIERLDAGDGHTIQMRYVAYASVQRVESNMTFRSHIYIAESCACQVRNNYIHHAHDYGGGGHGYGIDIIRHSTDCLVIDNVFKYLRHSMMTHVGTSGNVYAYNYSTEREPQRLCDISLHGHYSNANLFEGNVVEEIHVSDYWGPIGPRNTFLRNVITREGIDINDYSHGQNLVGNTLLRGRRITVHSSVENTLLHGNTVNDNTQWDPEISDRDIPTSYFLEEKPDFLEGYPWPLSGPDVETIHKLPAQLRYERGQPITGIEKKGSLLPQDYSLQAYPNPFNPQTTLRFELPREEHITVRVYTIDGRRLTTLIEEKLAKGTYEIPFRPQADQSSGVFFIQLQTGSRRWVEKITFLK